MWVEAAALGPSHNSKAGNPWGVLGSMDQSCSQECAGLAAGRGMQL